MSNLSVRIDTQDEANLDALVVAVRAYYADIGKAHPIAAKMAGEVTRSSALRDLLLAWKRGEANELFNCKLTGEVHD